MQQNGDGQKQYAKANVNVKLKRNTLEDTKTVVKIPIKMSLDLTNQWEKIKHG